MFLYFCSTLTDSPKAKTYSALSNVSFLASFDELQPLKVKSDINNTAVIDFFILTF